jgi:hypothetical protein
MLYVFLSTFMPPAWVEGAGKIGTLTIMPHPWVWEMPLGFYYIPGDKGEDSNIPVLSWSELTDGIDGVNSAYFTFKEGVCDYHWSADYQVTKGGEFEIVKNEAIIEGEGLGVLGTLTESNLIQKYGRYILLAIVLIALIILLKKHKKRK